MSGLEEGIALLSALSSLQGILWGDHVVWRRYYADVIQLTELLVRLPGLGLEEVKHSWPAERFQTHSRPSIIWLQSNFSGSVFFRFNFFLSKLAYWPCHEQYTV